MKLEGSLTKRQQKLCRVSQLPFNMSSIYEERDFMSGFLKRKFIFCCSFVTLAQLPFKRSNSPGENLSEYKHGTLRLTLLQHRDIYRGFHITFDKRVPKFVRNFRNSLRTWQFHYVLVNQIVNLEMKL